MDGKIRKISNGHNSYEIYEASADYLINIIDILIKKFEFTLVFPKLIMGLDGSYVEFKKGDIKITAGWDIWSGCFVHANCSNGDELIVNIGDYLNTLS